MPGAINACHRTSEIDAIADRSSCQCVDIADRMQAEKGAPLTEFEAAVLTERIAAARAWLESYAPERARLAVQRDAVPEEVAALREYADRGHG